MCWQAGALAHKTNLSRLTVAVAGHRVDVRLIVSAHDLALALGIETDLVAPVPKNAFEARADALGAYLAARLVASADGRDCRRAEAGTEYGRLPDEVIVRLVFRCPAAIARLDLGYLLFFDLDAGHRAIGTIDAGQGRREFLFDAEITNLEIEVAAPQPESALAWLPRAGRIVVLGIEHISTGVDHLLFLVALLLVSARFVDLVKIVTAFTLAHTLTLSLAWFGVIDLPSGLVESLIALSIAYVAAENLFAGATGHRWLLALGFGLVHGLGFYTFLKELDLGGAGAVTTLFAFNLGVEIGQLAFVAAVFPLLILASRRSWYRPAMRAGSALILLVATVWFVQRALI
ncbi:MAG: HupE/UreJ family protein [Alphaproteobacteria bacterium]|nr:HupE/UreJ family protein [Alphaproteobacteria bacterium]